MIELPFDSRVGQLIYKLRLDDSVAQLVEQYTFNVWVLGSNPSGITSKLKKPAFIAGFFVFNSFGKNSKYFLGYHPMRRTIFIVKERSSMARMV